MSGNIHFHIEVTEGERHRVHPRHKIWHHLHQPEVANDVEIFQLAAKIHAPSRCLPYACTTVTHHDYQRSACDVTSDNVIVIHASELDTLQQMLRDAHPEIPRNLPDADPLDLQESVFRTYIEGDTLSAHQGYEDLRIILWPVVDWVVEDLNGEPQT